MYHTNMDYNNHTLILINNTNNELLSLKHNQVVNTEVDSSFLLQHLNASRFKRALRTCDVIRFSSRSRFGSQIRAAS